MQEKNKNAVERNLCPQGGCACGVSSAGHIPLKLPKSRGFPELLEIPLRTSSLDRPHDSQQERVPEERCSILSFSILNKTNVGLLGDSAVQQPTFALQALTAYMTSNNNGTTDNPTTQQPQQSHNPTQQAQTNQTRRPGEMREAIK